MEIVFVFIQVLGQVLTFAILIRVMMTWFPIGANNPFHELIYRVTEPILAPLRKVVPRFGALDFTPMIAILILYVIQVVVSRAI
tara:strand:+ start:177 stop:428 length:252 start_codon:yes stop_codon:yes gene_type:complete